jgi:hypothetical protein
MQMTSRAELFKKSVRKNFEFERYLVSTEPKSAGFIALDSTRSYLITLPLSYFVSKRETMRSKGKADGMPFESFRIINMQHPGGHAHSLILIKSHAIKTNPHHIAIFEPNGRNKYCGFRILDDHHHRDKTKPMKNVTKAYNVISPKFNINYGSNTHNPGYCGLYGIICVVAFRHYRSSTGAIWLSKWKKLLAYMSKSININVGSFGVQLAAQVQEIIATNASHSLAEQEIATTIQSCISCKPENKESFII